MLDFRVRTASRTGCTTTSSIYPIAKGVWGCFSQDIVRAIHISIDFAFVTCLVQSSLDASSTKDWLTIDLTIHWNWIVIQKACFAGLPCMLPALERKIANSCREDVGAVERPCEARLCMIHASASAYPFDYRISMFRHEKKIASSHREQHYRDSWKQRPLCRSWHSVDQ